MATADFSQEDIQGVQYSSRFAYFLDNGNFIFYWDNQGQRKMILVGNNGEQLRGGYLPLPAKKWQDTESWKDTNGYVISNFRGYKGRNYHVE